MSIVKYYVVYFLLSFLFIGCAVAPSPPDGAVVGASPSNDPVLQGSLSTATPLKGSVVEVFYGTNRSFTSSSETKVDFNAKRSTNVSYGRCYISVPPGRDPGEINRPWFSWQEANPKKHMTLAKHSSYISFAAMANDIKDRPGKKIFVFIHGYNVKFEDAAFRTAQMADDLSFDGTPIFFSWPANGHILSYLGDENNIEWSTPYIRIFLEGLIEDVKEKDIYIIAHSIGTRGLTRAITELIQNNPNSADKIKEVILAAPDIDADVFMEQIMPAFSKAKLPMTIYTSNLDRALKLSSYLHGYLRVGNGAYGDKNLEIIDATNTDMDFLGHSYFAENIPILNDLFGLINNRARASERFMLKPVSTADGVFWTFKK